METLGFIIFEIILSSIGWLCLWVWYRDREKVKRIKDEKYGGSYSAAASVLFLNLVAGLGAIAMFGMVVFFLVHWLYKAITN